MRRARGDDGVQAPSGKWDAGLAIVVDGEQAVGDRPLCSATDSFRARHRPRESTQSAEMAI
jgi:hypothetical protein